MPEIKCGRCGVSNAYVFIKPKKCGFCGGDLKGRPLSEKELEQLWRRKGLMK